MASSMRTRLESDSKENSAKYDIGDMVWGKVKFHPWWPGQIYNELYASLPVCRSKPKGYVLVAFFGDSSYGWFDPAELLPFEPYFAEKSRQTSVKSFQDAVSEALDEFSRRIMLGFSCRCRNEFNFWASCGEGYLVVDVGENNPGLYSANQINKARESFRPNQMLSFVKKLASTPMNDGCHGTIEFIKNRAKVLACRKALFEEFDETYAQAFGIEPERAPRLTAPAAIDPSKTFLIGRLVIAESLGKGEISKKPTKTEDQVEKEQYLFQRRDELTQQENPQKALSVGQSGDPLSVDGSKFSGRAVYSGTGDHKHQMSTHSQPSRGIRTSDGSRKFFDGGAKKGKLHKRPAENANPVEKMKKKTKEMSTETSSDGAVAAVNNTTEKNPTLDDNEKAGGVVPTSSSVVEVNKQAVQLSKVDLPNALSNLRTLARDPLHATELSRLASVRQVFLIYRSIVFKKSLFNEDRRKRGPLDRPEEIKKKMTIDASDDIQKKKFPEGAKKTNISEATEEKNSISEDIDKEKKGIDESEGIKKRRITDGSSSETVAASQRQTESQLSSDVPAKSMPPPRKENFSAKSKGSSSKTVPAAKKKQPPPQSRTESEPRINSRDLSARSTPPSKSLQPTMLIMKFPTGATLPSVAQLKLKFSRFGLMDSSAARVFWNTHTCRLVYNQRVDAEAALRFASGSRDLFGSTNVRCYLREAAAPESESARRHKEDSAPKASNSAVDSSIASQPHRQVKSILKKPMGKKENEQPVVGGNMTQTPLIVPAVEEQVSNEPNQLPDISQEMMKLLEQNYDIIKNLERRLGHMPYAL